LFHSGLIQAHNCILYPTSAKKLLFKGVCVVAFVERGNPLLLKIIIGELNYRANNNDGYQFYGGIVDSP